jgi:hypothetical protein
MTHLGFPLKGLVMRRGKRKQKENERLTEILTEIQRLTDFLRLTEK